VALFVDLGGGDEVRLTGFNPSMPTARHDQAFVHRRQLGYAQLDDRGFDLAAARADVIFGANVADRFDGGAGNDRLGGQGQHGYAFGEGGYDVVVDQDLARSKPCRPGGITAADGPWRRQSTASPARARDRRPPRHQWVPEAGLMVRSGVRGRDELGRGRAEADV
jgi:hypothetical protein